MQALPPIESLECFLAAAKSLNFRNASQAVHLSPAAFGQRIRQLEDYLGIPLFARTTRQVHLTSAGERLLPRVQTLLDSLVALPALAHDDEIVMPRSITIATRHELGLSWLTPLLMRLEKAVAGVTLHLHFTDSDDMLRKLRDGAIDAAISSVRLADSRFAFELLHEEHYCLVASKKLARREGLDTLPSLSDQTLLDADATLPLARYWLDAHRARANLQFRQIRYLGTIGAIRDFVLRGAGVAVLPRYFIAGDLERGRMQLLFPKKKLLSDHFRLLFSRTSRQTEIFGKFAEIMRESPLR